MGAHSPRSPLRVGVAARRAEAVKLRAAGLTWQEIADRLEYRDKRTACNDVKRALAKMEAETATELRALEGDRLDMMWRKAMAVLDRDHVMVSHGRVIEGDDGFPLQDDDPILRAISTLLQIQARRARLFGLDAPKSVEVITVDAVEQEIRRLTDELGRLQADEAPGAEASSG